MPRDEAVDALLTKPLDLDQRLLECEHETIKQALAQTDGSVTHAAPLIGRTHQGLAHNDQNETYGSAPEADASDTATTPKESEPIKMITLGAELVLTHPDHWYRERFWRASKSVGISYGQKSPGGWTPHDLRHTCLTNLAIAGVPINGIKEYAGHASIVETQKYLKFMPQSIELAAKASDRLGQLSRTQLDTEVPPASEQSLHLVKKLASTSLSYSGS